MYAGRSPVSGNFGKASGGHCLATCTCLHAACISHGKAPACSNAALADDTGSKPTSRCSTGINNAAPPMADLAASGVKTHLSEGTASSEGRSVCSHVSSCRSNGDAGRANSWHPGECHAHAIFSRNWLTGCLGWNDQQVRTCYPLGDLMQRLPCFQWLGCQLSGCVVITSPQPLERSHTL